MTVSQQNSSLVEPQSVSRLEGIIRCSRYAFGPNRLHYCGPDANQEILSYLEEGRGDPGLLTLMKQFATMYPYLDFISRANKIYDPFDERVVEAYWLGNPLLDKVNKQQFYYHLKDGLRLNKRLNIHSFNQIKEKVGLGAIPHHSFHVLNVWNRTGHHDVPHTLESMDACRVSYGKVSKIDGPNISLKYKPLISINNKLSLGELVTKAITRKLESDFDEVKVGDTISFHWNVPCEVLNEVQVKRLDYYTLLSIKLANKFL